MSSRLFNKMNISTSDFWQFANEIPRTLQLVVVLFPVAGLVLGYVSGFDALPENTRLFLSGLAGAQAGVLAIVFSVTVIGIQLIATRYSPRMISLFTDSPIFICTFSLFVFSIAVDLGLLLAIPESYSRLHVAGVGAAAGLGLTAAITLFVFVRTAIRQSTPDGAIDAFVSRMTTEKYLSEVRKSVESDAELAHPMHPLYNLIMNALSSGERVTAGKALQEYGSLAQKTLSDLDDCDVFSEEEERQVITQLFEPVFKEHLHDVALHAEEQDEIQLVGDATEWQYELGNDGLDFSDDTVARQAQFGLSDVLRDAPIETGTYISSNSAWRQIGQFLVDAAEKPNPRIVRNTASSIETNVSRQLWKVGDVRWYDHSMMRLYNDMEKAHEALLNHYVDDVAEVDMEWHYEHVPDDTPNREEVYAVFQWKETLLDTTEGFLRYAAKEGRYPITEGNFKDSWKNICIQASKSHAEDYAVTLCQALIEIAVIDRHLLDENGIPWSYTIGRVKYKGNPEIVDRAFQRILEYDYIEEEPGPLFVGEMEEHYETYYRNLLSLEDYRPLNTLNGFKEAIREIQEEADNRWNTLKE